MPGAPFTGWPPPAFPAAVLVLVSLDHPIGSWTVAPLVVAVPALIGRRHLVRERVLAVARERLGFSGEHPVVAPRPATGPDGA